MEAGKLRHKILIQKASEDFDENGELIQNWDNATTFAEAYAEILPAVGREFWASKQIVAEITGKMRLRYIAGVNSKMRVKFGSRIFNIIVPINIEEKNIELVLMVSEKQ